MRRLAFGTFLLATSVVALAAAPVVQRQLSGSEQVHHVLNRLAFGPRPGDVDRVKAIGVDRWIAQQLDPSRIRNDANERLIAAAFPSVSLTAERLFDEAPPPNVVRRQARRRGDTVMTREDSVMLRQVQREARQVVGDVVGARVARAVASERQLEEVMVDFWLNHFTVFAGKNIVRYYIADYEREAIRPHALGNFRELLGAVAKSPAMLLYLDNAQSVADSTQPTLGGRFTRAQNARGRLNRRPQATPGIDSMLARMPRGLNENYARELLELHTLGVDGGYTQKDVIEVARALTGWTVPGARQGTIGFRFVPMRHDAGEKVVLGRRLAAGRGIEDGEDVLNIVATHPATARHISRKLVVRFVSDSPPPALVDRAAATFTRTRGDIREVVRTIVTSDEFFSRAAYRAKVKSPFEVVVSALRALGASADTTPRTAGVVALLGQPIYGHQAPNGWPETGEAWLNTGAILNRINFALALAAGRLPGVSARTWAGDSVGRLSRPAQIDLVVNRLLGGHASAPTREILSSGRNPLLERAAGDSANEPVSNDTATDMIGVGRPMGMRRAGFGAPPKLSGVAQLVGLALGSPEFQRR
ncbi:MAG TPA: DUF1800 domain-containing protein [Gemmatimonadaceae bacterium]|nr:DUF1800 domain-containing protein [Gemmatimonadaceae bacterium]